MIDLNKCIERKVENIGVGDQIVDGLVTKTIIKKEPYTNDISLLYTNTNEVFMPSNDHIYKIFVGDRTENYINEK